MICLHSEQLFRQVFGRRQEDRREDLTHRWRARQGVGIDEAAKRHAADYALQRITSDDDVANACLFLASDVSRQITGVDLPVDGGWAML